MNENKMVFFPLVPAGAFVFSKMKHSVLLALWIIALFLTDKNHSEQWSNANYIPQKVLIETIQFCIVLQILKGQVKQQFNINFQLLSRFHLGKA